VNKQKLIAKLVELQKDKNVTKAAIAEIVQSIFDHMAIAIVRNFPTLVLDHSSFESGKKE
jgi:nucleoid DNA-binding protein